MDWTDIRLGNLGMKTEEAGGPQLDFPAIGLDVVDSWEIAEDSYCACYVGDSVKHWANVRAGRNSDLH